MKTPALLAALLALAACSTPSPKAPDVASLSTPAASGTTTSAPKEERPRERLDMTPEDYEALVAPWKRCMADLGLDLKGRAQPGSGPEPSKDEVDRALKACESKDPLPPWEKDTANPEAVDFATRVVQCLRDKGVRYVEVDNEPGANAVSYAFGGPNNDEQSITLGLQNVSACEVEASKK